MKIGINTFLFAFPFSDKDISWFPKFKSWGYDGVEIAVNEPSDIHAQSIKEELAKNHLSCCSLCGVFGPNRDLRGTSEQQESAISYISELLDLCVELDCPKVIGPVYSSVGRAENIPESEKGRQLKLVTQNLNPLCQKAESLGLTIALEPLNRFETDFINTCEQALDLVKAVDSSALKIHLDTFHMNIEEKDPAAAIKQAGSHFGHLHACGCDRGITGKDQIQWPHIAKALKAVGYDDYLVVESFTTDIKAIAKAASIWRCIDGGPETIAQESARFLKSQF